MAENISTIQEEIIEPLTQISPAIEFPCIVNSKQLTAKITSEEDTLVTLAYHIIFSDGYEADFYSIEEELEFFEMENKESDYAKAVNNDLVSIRGFNKDKKIYCIPPRETGEHTNAWLLQDAKNENTFRVYTGKYRFTLKNKDNQWIISHRDKSKKIDDRLAAKLFNYLQKNAVI